ncbi:hypothetical protein M9458_054956, partial [Cirrhinus mrigala]
AGLTDEVNGSSSAGKHHFHRVNVTQLHSQTQQLRRSTPPPDPSPLHHSASVNTHFTKTKKERCVENSQLRDQTLML